MDKYIGVGGIALILVIKAAQTNLMFAVGYLLSQIIIATLAAPLIWWLIYRRPVWHWWQWTNCIGIIVVVLFGLVQITS